MCGIYGYVGNGKSTIEFLKGLQKLEYRGYDSCGCCYYNYGYFKLIKSVGNVNSLISKMKNEITTCCIGHTRWATHGKINIENAHPHEYKDFVVVHNGIIENYQKLKEELSIEHFYGETDSEVIAHLLNKYSIKELFNVLKGNYAILILDKKNPNEIWFMNNGCPLLFSKTCDGFYFSSDIIAFNKGCKAYILPNGSYGCISLKKQKIYNIYNNYNISSLIVEDYLLTKRTKEHFIYEIEQQPQIISDIIDNYSLVKDSIMNKIKKANKIYFIGCGSSYYAASYIAMFYSKYFKIKAQALIASEYSSDFYITDINDCYIFLSQSGETADVVECYYKIKSNNKILITNTINSSLARLIEDVCYIYAFPEISVAATKSFTASVITAIMLAMRSYCKYFDVSFLKNKIELIINDKDNIKITAKRFLNKRNIFIIGNAMMLPIAMEVALKIKEVTYLNCWAIASGELKHGTISLVDEESLAVGFDDLCLEELKSRGCEIIKPEILIDKPLSELGFVIYMQMITYYIALFLNKNVDQPRNLAKSVTVK